MYGLVNRSILSAILWWKCCVSWSGDRDQYGEPGNAFSLLPAQNATGNWIKIVQRVPVEVSLDPKELMEHPLRIGLSMTATIDTKNEDIAEMPDLASTVTSMPAYTSKALVIDTSPIEKEN